MIRPRALLLGLPAPTIQADRSFELNALESVFYLLYHLHLGLLKYISNFSFSNSHVISSTSGAFSLSEFSCGINP